MSLIGNIQKRFGTKMVYRNLPFVYFIAFMGILYIANVHYAERNMRAIQKLKVELNESRWKYMSIKSDVMYNSMPSQIAGKVAYLEIEGQGIKPMSIRYKGKVD